MISDFFRRLVPAVAGTLFLAAAVQAEKPPQYFVDEAKLPFDAIPGLPAAQYWGVHKGAGYRVEVPANWNGDLVLWAHGFRGSGLELTVDNHPLRPLLLQLGYAWAASSYSRNDYDVEAGAKDTHALTRYFNGLVGKPDKVYLTGASMGGHVTGVAIEQWPNAYDGAMPICGVMGDYELFDYFLSYNLVAQALAGFPAGQVDFPPDPVDYLFNRVPAVISQLGPAFPFALNAQGQALYGVTANLTGGDRPVFLQGFLFWNAIPGLEGLAPFLFELGASDGTLPRQPGVGVDNADTIYQIDSDPMLSPEELFLNEFVKRVTADPQARKNQGITNVPPINGDITIPVLTLHTLGDLFVPFSMQQFYRQRVEANGRSELLVQRAIRDLNHCGFTGEELATAFLDLVSWVETGAKPAGDDVLDPAVVADPDYGCAFTSEDRSVPAGFPPIAACPAP
ncbi:MAG: prolyl oligopeptidase family serine peptidase [Gammaproteobacteria bacterium]